MSETVRALIGGWLVALLLAGCGSEAVRPPPADLQSFEAVDHIEKVWSRGVGDDLDGLRLRLEPVVVGKQVVAASRDGELTAVDLKSGQVLWTADLETPVLAGVAADAQQVYVATRHGEIKAVSLSNRELVWTAPLSSEVVTRPTVAEGRLYAYLINGTILAMDSATGQVIWSQRVIEPNLTLRGTAPVTYASGRVFVPTSSGRVLALDAASGKRVWSLQVGEPAGRTLLDRLVDVDGALSLHRGILTVLGYQGQLIQAELASGRKLWGTPASGYTAPAVNDELIVITEDNGDMRAWDNRTGQPLWQTSELAWRELTAPVIWQGRIAVADLDGYVHLLDAQTGKIRARIRVDRAPVQVRPQVAGSRLLIQTQGGELVCLSLGRDDNE